MPDGSNFLLTWRHRCKRSEFTLCPTHHTSGTLPKTLDTGETLDLPDVVFGQDELSQSAVIAVTRSVFGWQRKGRFSFSTRDHFDHTFQVLSGCCEEKFFVGSFKTSELEAS